MARRSILSKSSFALVAVLPLVVALQTAAAKPDKKKAREHFEQAEAFMKTGVYDEAVLEYKKAYEFAPKAHGFLFNIGLAYEKWGKAEEAVEYYALYLKKQPKGKKRAEARARRIALERAIAKKKQAEEKPDDDDTGADDTGDNDTGDDDNTGDDDAGDDDTGDDDKGDTDVADAGDPDNKVDVFGPTPGEPVDRGSGRKKSWALIGVGVAMIAGGIALDVAPDSASNGEFDALDLAPTGLYAAGATLIFVGVF